MTQDDLTPKSLKEAVIYFMCFGPLKELADRAPNAITGYLRQCFKKSYGTARTDGEKAILERLWRDITGGESIHGEERTS